MITDGVFLSKNDNRLESLRLGASILVAVPQRLLRATIVAVVISTVFLVGFLLELAFALFILPMAGIFGYASHSTTLQNQVEEKWRMGLF